MKKLLDFFGKTIDWFSRNIDRLKVIGIILLTVLFVLSIGDSGCKRNNIIELTEQLTGLQLKNIFLNKKISKKDSIIQLREIQIDSLKKVVKTQKNNEDQLEIRTFYLQSKIKGLRDSIMNIPVDTSYVYLTETAYPYEGERIYPLNRPQIKNIHLDYLENKELDKLNDNLEQRVSNCKKTVDTQDKIIIKYGEQVFDLLVKEGDYKQIIDNKGTENDILKDEIKKEKRGKTFWQVVSGVLGGIAVLVAL